jgi:hypothetical protein
MLLTRHISNNTYEATRGSRRWNRVSTQAYQNTLWPQASWMQVEQAIGQEMERIQIYMTLACMFDGTGLTGTTLQLLPYGWTT